MNAPATLLVVLALAPLVALAGPRGVPRPTTPGAGPTLASPIRAPRPTPLTVPGPQRRQLELEHAVENVGRELRQRADERALRRDGTAADLNRYRMREQMRDALERIGRDLDERALERDLEREGHAARPLDGISSERAQRERDRDRRFDARVRALERELAKE